MEKEKRKEAKKEKDKKKKFCSLMFCTSPRPSRYLCKLLVLSLFCVIFLIFWAVVVAPVAIDRNLSGDVARVVPRSNRGGEAGGGGGGLVDATKLAPSPKLTHISQDGNSRLASPKVSPKDSQTSISRSFSGR